MLVIVCKGNMLVPGPIQLMGDEVRTEGFRQRTDERDMPVGPGQ